MSNQKSKKTARELEDMISDRMGGARVNVYKDLAYGWHPSVFAQPQNVVRLQQRAEEIAAELRTRYDLED